jgi:hypothetical protein
MSSELGSGPLGPRSWAGSSLCSDAGGVAAGVSAGAVVCAGGASCSGCAAAGGAAITAAAAIANGERRDFMRNACSVLSKRG